MAFVAIFFAAVVALVNIKISHGSTDVVFVGAAVRTGMNVIGHGVSASAKIKRYQIWMFYKTAKRAF